MNHWPHAPVHILDEAGTFMVTGATYKKELFFKTSDNLDFFESLLLELAQQYGWHLSAWAVFPNHYHFIAQSPDNPSSLSRFITHLHSVSSKHLNKQHKTPGRKVWHQYWDMRITFHNSYLARLNYVIQNPVKHGIVTKANQYKWCSASWFEHAAEPSFFHTVTNFKTNSVNVLDDF